MNHDACCTYDFMESQWRTEGNTSRCEPLGYHQRCAHLYCNTPVGFAKPLLIAKQDSIAATLTLKLTVSMELESHLVQLFINNRV